MYCDRMCGLCTVIGCVYVSFEVLLNICNSLVCTHVQVCDECKKVNVVCVEFLLRGWQSGSEAIYHREGTEAVERSDWSVQRDHRYVGGG